MLRHHIRSHIILLTTLAIVAMLASPTAAQGNETGRAPLTVDLFMDSAPYTPPTGDDNGTDNDTGPQAAPYEPQTDPMTLAFGGSGTPTQMTSGCGNQGRGQMTVVAEWISEPLSEFPLTFDGTVNVTINFVDAQIPAYSLGAVDMQLQFLAGAGHTIASRTVTITPAGAAPGAPGLQMPDSVTIPLEADQHTIPAGAALVMALGISCPQGEWNWQTGAVPTMEYYIGDPNDADTDGDGIPNGLDDDDDGDTVSDTIEAQVGSDPLDASVTPESDSATCAGYTYQEVFDETGDPASCPVEDSFPWLLVILAVLVALLLLGAGGGAFVVLNKQIKMTISHDGFQAVEKGQSAEYELTLTAAGKKEAEIPVELTLKGVPEDWSAHLEPSHMTLIAGEAAESKTASLRMVPPPGEEYENEAQVTVTATPVDEEGKSSATKPGTSVKAKTIVNIGVTPAEGEGKKAKKAKKVKAETEPEAAAESEDDADEGGKGKKKGLGGFLKRKKADDDTPAEEAAEAQADATASEPPATGAAAAAGAAAATGGKPQLAMGKMVHDPADFSAGDEVTTTVTVRNKGDGPANGLTLSLLVNDARADQQVLDLEPGDSQEVTFKWTAQPDENRVKLKGSMKGA